MPLEEMEGRAVHELEFLPEDYIRARFQRRIGFIRSWLLLAIGLAMVLWSLQMGAWVRDARAELQALRGTCSAVDPDVKKVQMLRTEARSYNRRLELLRNLRPKIIVADVIGDVVDLLPQGVMLDALRLDYPEGSQPERVALRLHGCAPNETLVMQVAAALDTSARFEHAILVELKTLSDQADGRRSFVIEARVVPVAPAQER